jgi:outer membrane protein assembly factor BamB
MFSKPMKYLMKFLNCFLVTIFSFSAQAENWANWRGPNYDGSTSSSKPVPVKFDAKDRVKWKIPLPGASSGTPIVWDDRVFISSIRISDAKTGTGQLLAMCVDRSTGKILWEQNAGSGYRPGKGDGFDYQLDSKATYANASPVTDGNLVVFSYGNGDLVAYDMGGKELWRRNIQKDYGDFCFQWTFSASTTLHAGKLYLPVLQRNEPVHGRGKPNAPSFLLCMNPQTGKTIWQHERHSDANKESLESFGTIIPHKGQLLVAGGDVLTGHDPATGNEIWRWGTWNPGHKEQWWRLVPSPVAGSGVVLACAPKKAPVYAVKLGFTSTRSGKDDLAWESSANPQVTSDVPTPLFYGEKFFVLSDLKKTLSCIQPNSGKVEWSTVMPGKYKWRASPTAASGKIYTMNHNGEVVVIDAKDGSILHSAKMGKSYDDNTRASVAISDGQLFIRTNENLYCIH